MNSVEKVKEALTRAEGAADDTELEQHIRIVANFVGVARPHIERFLPEDPGELDVLLDQGGEWLLSLRSDPAELNGGT